MNPQAQWQAALDEGRFTIQHCAACGRHVHFPRTLCPHCGASALQWVQPSGQGTVYANTTVRRKAEDGGDIDISLVDLDEGVRLMSHVTGGGRIGQRVRARIEQRQANGKPQGLVVFDPVEAAA